MTLPGLHVAYGWFDEGHSGPGWYAWDEDHRELGAGFWDCAPSLAQIAAAYGGDDGPVSVAEVETDALAFVARERVA